MKVGFIARVVVAPAAFSLFQVQHQKQEQPTFIVSLVGKSQLIPSGWLSIILIELHCGQSSRVEPLE